MVQAVLLAVCLAATACGPSAETATTRDPLATFLASHKDLHLLVRDDWTDKAAEKDATEPPTLLTDTTGDGIPDLTAVVVTNTEPRKFSVISFTRTGHGWFATSPVRVVTDSDRALVGVVSFEKAIVPLQCVGCDSNT